MIGHLAFSELTLTPPDAGVLVDGQEVSTDDPVAVETGRHTLSFVSDGFSTQERDVVVEAGQTVSPDDEISLTPVLQQGAIIVRSAVPVDVFENETQLGSAPFTGQFDPGPHTLEFRHENLSTQLVYQIQPNQTVPVDLGVVRVNSDPFGQVELLTDGGTSVIAGTTPGRILVPAGATLVFTHPQFEAREVRLEAGQTAVSVSFAAP